VGSEIRPQCSPRAAKLSNEYESSLRHFAHVTCIKSRNQEQPNWIDPKGKTLYSRNHLWPSNVLFFNSFEHLKAVRRQQPPTMRTHRYLFAALCIVMITGCTATPIHHEIVPEGTQSVRRPADRLGIVVPRGNCEVDVAHRVTNPQAMGRRSFTQAMGRMPAALLQPGQPKTAIATMATRTATATAILLG
jgi:hypothetical protein